MKNKYFKLILAATGLFIGSTSMAQEGFQCGSDVMRQRLIQEHPEIIQNEAALEKFVQKWVEERRKANDPINPNNYDTLHIPIVFHIIHGYGAENITDEQILSQMDILNRDFSATNPDISQVIPEYADVVGSMKIKFHLATIDPQGNCTNGIDRIGSLETAQGDDGSKLNPWDRKKYLNVWVMGNMEGGVAGYAYFPGSVAGPFNPVDGINIRHNYIGDRGTSNPFASRALTHEIGHYLNLPHTWGFNNDPAVVCGDDLVFDTPVTKGHNNCQNVFDALCDIATIQASTFANVTTSSGSTDPTPIFDTLGFDQDAFKAVGLSAQSTRNGAFAFSQWPTGSANGDTALAQMTGSIDAGKYYEFTVSPRFANRLTIRNLLLNISRTDNGPRTFAVRTSLNNYSSNVKIAKTSLNSGVDSLPGNIYFIKGDEALSAKGLRFAFDNSINQRNSPVTFRIYAWNAEGAAGVFALDSVWVDGESAKVENVQNYMEYSYCSNMFTKGQILRMLATFSDSTDASSYRRNLWQTSNHQATGINGFEQKCAPKADFYANRLVACTNGAAVNFRDNSQKAFVTSRVWDIQDATYVGGTNNTSATPQVRFTSPGWKSVSLTVTGTEGSNTKSVEKFIYVSDETVALAAPHIESFESQDVLGNTWLVHNFENNQTKFQANSNTSYFGTSCVKLNAFESQNAYSLRDGNGDIDYLYTPAFNLSGKEGWVVTFKLASATRSSDPAKMTQSLKFEYSSNCGSSWVNEKELNLANLNTSGYNLSNYTPQRTSLQEWKEIVVPITPAIAKDNVRFRFTYTSASASNNLYIDDFFIGQAAGLDEKVVSASDFNVAPNPITSETNVQFFLAKDSEVKFNITDITGKELNSMSLTLNSGEQKVNIQAITAELPAGVYMLNIGIGSSKIAKKLVVQ